MDDTIIYFDAGKELADRIEKTCSMENYEKKRCCAECGGFLSKKPFGHLVEICPVYKVMQYFIL